MAANGQVRPPGAGAGRGERLLTRAGRSARRPRPRQAFRLALQLNNKYFLDGRDPNSFAGVAWCFGKHDRPWAERAVFGKVRYMNAAGLERKSDMAAYLRRVGNLGP